MWITNGRRIVEALCGGVLGRAYPRSGVQAVLEHTYVRCEKTELEQARRRPFQCRVAQSNTAGPFPFLVISRPTISMRS